MWVCYLIVDVRMELEQFKCKITAVDSTDSLLSVKLIVCYLLFALLWMKEIFTRKWLMGLDKRVKDRKHGKLIEYIKSIKILIVGSCFSSIFYLKYFFLKTWQLITYICWNLNLHLTKIILLLIFEYFLV